MAGVITQALLDNLRTSFNGIFQSAWERTEVVYPGLVTQVPSDSEFETYGFIKGQLKLREWIGPRDIRALDESAYAVVNKTYQESFEIPRTKIEDDKLGLYSTMFVPQLGEASRKLPDELLAELLEANPVAFDGTALFADARNYGGGAFDNNYTLALSVDNVETVRAAMCRFLDANGEPLRVNPDTLIVPPALERTAREVAYATLRVVNGGSAGAGAAAIDNVMSGRYNVVVMPELSVTDRWYLADMSRTIKPVLFQERTAPEIVQITQADSESVFLNDAYSYGVRYRCRMAPAVPHLISVSEP